MWYHAGTGGDLQRNESYKHRPLDAYRSVTFISRMRAAQQAARMVVSGEWATLPRRMGGENAATRGCYLTAAGGIRWQANAQQQKKKKKRRSGGKRSAEGEAGEGPPILPRSWTITILQCDL